MAESTRPSESLTIASEAIEVTMLPGKGADLTSLVDRRSGVDVLFRSPWGRRPPNARAAGSLSIERWVEAYPGGWQLLLPNGGDECAERGATWGYHGEAALACWDVIEANDRRAVLETRLFSVPLHVRRELSVSGPLLSLEETVTNESAEPLEVMWSHHPAFGAPFLEGGCVISAGCRSVLADDEVPGTLLEPGTRHEWPEVRTAGGAILDLSLVPPPDEPRAVLAYLGDFSSGWAAITNPRLGLGIGLRWPLDTFPYAWLWQEVHSGEGWPWYRRAYVVAVEPASTIPGHGMVKARAKGYRGVTFGPQESRSVVLEAVLFEGEGAVAGIDAGGVVRRA